MQPYIVPPSFEGFVSIIKNMQLIRLNVYEFDKTFNYTVILHFKIIKITPECTQVTPDHIRSSPNHALGKYFLYWASPNNFSSLSSSSLLIITKQGQYHRNRSFAWCWCLVYMIFQITGLPAWVFAFLASKGFLTSVGKHVIFQSAWPPAREAALITGKGFLSRMLQLVFLDIITPLNVLTCALWCDPSAWRKRCN